ncbi:hypothetical protein [Limnohabitans sp. TS-CS-82]|nr:hypothetical protein [Limnohabitans sp. TS-CS-82]
MNKWQSVAMTSCVVSALAWADAEDYKIKVDVTQQGNVFYTQASFHLP